MQITAPQLIKHQLVDHMVDEPLGGAHRDHDTIAASLGVQIASCLTELDALDSESLIEQRYKKLRGFGVYK